MTTWRILVGDVRERLADLPDQSVQCVVTSPPYWGLRDYGHAGQLGLEDSPDRYVAGIVGVFQGIRRVLREDGTVWLNLGDSYAGGHSGRNDVGRTISDRGGNYRHDGIGPSIVIPRPLAGAKPKDLVG